MSESKKFTECSTETEFKDFMFHVYVTYYGLKCTCGEGTEEKFNQASGHYQRCDYWKFCHSINRALEWSKLKK